MAYVRIQLEETPRYENASALTPYRVSTVPCDIPITSFLMDPAPTHLDRSDELRNIEGSVARLIDAFEPAGSIAERMYLNSLCFLLQIGGWVSTITAGLGTNATKGINSTNTAGAYTGGTATLTVVSTAGFPDAGSLQVAGITGLTTYTGKTATTFTGCSGGTGTSGASALVEDILPVGAYKHIFAKRGGVTAKTAQMIGAYTAQSIFFKGQGYGVSQLNLNAAGEMTADIMGLVFARIADPSLTPAIDAGAIVPMRRADLSVVWLAGTGETDDFTVSISNPLARRKTFGLSTRSYFSDKMLHGDERVAVTGSIPKYALANADIDSLLSAATFVASARWRSDRFVGATTYPYSLDIEMPACQLVGGAPEPLNNNRRQGGSYDWYAAWDETAGYDARIEMVNAVPALETYV